MKKHLAIAAFVAFGSITARGTEESETTMTASTLTLAKTQFSDLETIEGVIEGIFATDCLQLEAPVITIATTRIDIQPRAFRARNFCRDAVVPWRQSVKIQNIPAGDYLLTFGIAGPRQLISVKPHTEMH